MAIEENAAEGPEGRLGGFLRSRLFLVIRTVISLAVIAGLVIKLSPADIARSVRNADAPLLIVALLLMFVSQSLVVAKWTRLLRARDVRPPLPLIARSYCIGVLLSMLLPTAIGGDIYRIYRVQREAGVRAADVTMTVLYERATGYAAMTCLGALGAAFYFGALWIGVAALLGGAALALLMLLALPRLPLPALRQDHILRNLVSHRRELIAVYQMAVFSLLIQVVYISSIAVAGRAFGVHASWWYWAFGAWLIAIALLLPIAIGGLGVRESSFSALVTHVGASAAQGASTGFALGVLLVTANAIGLALIEAAERTGYLPRAVPLEPRTPAKVRG
ncbi:MAG: lysylphosphatidylglycerol synthase transmembrane domain-containing protein [Dehalococcoidia bacterium]